MTRSIAKVLKEEGFIADLVESETTVEEPQILVTLKYKGKTRQPIIRNLTRVSKPGLRVYSNRKELPRVLGGHRHRHYFYLQWHHDRSRCSPSGHWR
jgi:small subunit ribosomal protein S8